MLLWKFVVVIGAWQKSWDRLARERGDFSAMMMAMWSVESVKWPDTAILFDFASSNRILSREKCSSAGSGGAVEQALVTYKVYTTRGLLDIKSHPKAAVSSFTYIIRAPIPRLFQIGWFWWRVRLFAKLLELSWWRRLVRHLDFVSRIPTWVITWLMCDLQTDDITKPPTPFNFVLLNIRSSSG